MRDNYKMQKKKTLGDSCKVVWLAGNNNYHTIILTICLATCLILLPTTLFAQKKQIQTARDLVKAGKDLDKAVVSMQGLLKDSANRRNPKIWAVLCDALVAQYEQGNEKLYLKQTYDTTALFSVTRKLFESMAAFDSIDALPNSRGQIRLEHREKNASFLHSIRPNLFNGGVYYTRKQKYKDAYDYYEMYIASTKWPLFNGYQYNHKDPLMPHAAYWAMYCGYKLKKPELIVRYQDIAERDTSMLNFVRQYQAEAFLLKEDTTQYVAALRDGFERYPNFAFFFPRLIAYYEQHEQHASALAVVDRALEADSTSVLFRLTKSSILLNMGQYDSCIALCKKMLEEKDSLAEAYYNIGLAYFNQAIELDKVEQKYRSKRQQINALYKEALPYLEQYRTLNAGQRERWLPPLYTIYLNLNMGKEFDELNKKQ